MKFWKRPFSFLWNHKRISAGLIIILIAAFIFWPRPKPPIPTQTISRKEFVQSLSVSGSVVAKKTVNLTFPISGRLAYVGVKKGDNVFVTFEIPIKGNEYLRGVEKGETFRVKGVIKEIGRPSSTIQLDNVSLERVSQTHE